MPVVEIPLAGPTYQARSLPAGNQHTQNFYIELNPQGDENAVLMPFPGLKSFATAGTSADRGMGVLNEVLYRVSGNKLYRVSSNGAVFELGSIEGSGRCVLLEDNFENLIICTGEGKPYTLNGDTLTQGTDQDLPNASTGIYINDRVVYESEQGLAFADLGAPLVVNSANVLSANTKADGVQAVSILNQIVLLFGNKSIEPSQFVGSGTPPYARVNNSVQSSGTIAKYSVSSNNTHTYFLDNRKGPARLAGLTIERIGNPAIGKEIASYPDVSDCFTLPFTLDDQDFVLYVFPTGNASWLFNTTSLVWTNLSYGVDGDRSVINSYANVYDKHLVADRRNGNIYELDFDTYTDNGDVVQRVRTTKALDAKDLGLSGRMITLNNLVLTIEPGASDVSEASQIILEWSDDNGRTWSSERWSSIGELGDFTYKVEWTGLGSFEKRIFRFTMSDGIKWVLVSCQAEVEVGVD